MLFQETESIELKRIFNDTIEKEIVAFLNCHQGNIYIGVEDNGTVVGVDNVDKIMKDIADVITTKILPNPQEFIETKVIYEQDKRVIVIEVKKGNSLYYIKKYGRSATGCYTRIGTSCRSMTEEQIEKGYAKTVKELKCSIIEEESHRQSLTFKIFKIYLDAKDINYSDDNFDENNKLLNKKKKYNYLAYLLSDQFDISVKIAKFDGNNKRGEFVYRKEFGNTSLIKTIEDVPNFIETNINKVRSYFDSGVQRRDEFLLDKNSVREAWVNACCHNDWFTHLGPAVYIYNDHIEFFSYGNPLERQNKEKFLADVSNPINPELAMILMKLGIIEQSGKGINTIVNHYGESAFVFSDKYLQVELHYNKKALEETNPNVGANVGANVGVKLSDSEKKIIELISTNSLITAELISKELNLTKRTIERNISSLQSKKVLERIGSDKTGYWRINE